MNERTDDILETFRITRKRSRAMGGTWVHGTIGDYRFEALVFEDHAMEPAWELDRTRISKFWSQKVGERGPAACFDRGWDTEPVEDDAKFLVDSITDVLAEIVFG